MSRRITNTTLALKRGLPWVERAEPHGGTFIVTAGGPSLDRAAFTDGAVISCGNQVHEWLIDRGIIPDFCVFCEIDIDPEAMGIRPRHDVVYLLATHCMPSAFDYFDGYNVRLWHADQHSTNPVANEACPNIAIVKCGATCGLRQLGLGYAMGWRDFDCYGLDSSFNGATHAYKDAPGVQIEVDFEGKTYRTTQPLERQSRDFVRFCLNNPMSIRVHGDGLLPDRYAQQFGV